MSRDAIQYMRPEELCILPQVRKQQNKEADAGLMQSLREVGMKVWRRYSRGRTKTEGCLPSMATAAWPRRSRSAWKQFRSLSRTYCSTRAP